MKILLTSIVSIYMLTSCGPLPGFEDKPTKSNTPPASGCKNDVTVNFTNNCDKTLFIYFTEGTPGTIVNCGSLNDAGIINRNQKRQFTIHKGKTGFFVFAEDPEGKCVGGHRKAETWVDCSKADSDAAFFNICN